ncbi:MAG: hypothetical protein ACE5F4_02340 [Candidatus Paceibacteria bacterium]
MEELDIQGKKYISSKRAAEVTGYAKDYVGQLARSGKIPATRVGRAWYVDEDTIKRHAGIRTLETSDSSEVVTSAKPAEVPEREEVATRTTHPPVAIANRTLSLSAMRASQLPKYDVLKTWTAVRYLPDNSQLFPEVKRKEKETEAGTVTIHRIDSAKSGARRPVRVSEKKIPAPKTTIVFDATVKKIPLERKTDYVSRHKEIIKGKRKRHQRVSHPTFPYALRAVSSAVLLVAFALWGTTIPSEWTFSAGDTHTLLLAGSEAADQFGLIGAYFASIFDSGVALIDDFFFLLFASLGQLFQTGLDFIVYLLNLV